jgi:hypothetical protein
VIRRDAGDWQRFVTVGELVLPEVIADEPPVSLPRG